MNRRRQERESEELEAMIRRMQRALVRRARAGDTTALEALARLERSGSAATTVALAAAHTSGGGFYSYGELAQTMRTSRQAVMQRIGRQDQAPAELRSWLLG